MLFLRTAAWVLMGAPRVVEIEAQADASAADERFAGAEAIEEVTVIGERLLRHLRLDVQIAREGVYDLFNTLNGRTSSICSAARTQSSAAPSHKNVAVVVFSRPDVGYGGSLAFAESYEEVASLLRSRQFADARRRNERMQREHAISLEEIGLAQMQFAAIEHALGDSQAALTAIRRATEPSVAALAEEEFTITPRRSQRQLCVQPFSRFAAIPTRRLRSTSFAPRRFRAADSRSKKAL